jgi:hypothetical protein
LGLRFSLVYRIFDITLIRIVWLYFGSLIDYIDSIGERLEEKSHKLTGQGLLKEGTGSSHVPHPPFQVLESAETEFSTTASALILFLNIDH